MNFNNLKHKVMKKVTILINDHEIAIEGVHSRIEFIAISRAVGILGQGLISFTVNGKTYMPSHFMINNPYYSEKAEKIDSGKIKIVEI